MNDPLSTSRDSWGWQEGLNRLTPPVPLPPDRHDRPSPRSASAAPDARPEVEHLGLRTRLKLRQAGNTLRIVERAVTQANNSGWR
jgi:hypothetical protein